MLFIISLLLFVIAFLLFVLIWSDDDARDTLLELLDGARARPVRSVGLITVLFLTLAALALLG